MTNTYYMKDIAELRDRSVEVRRIWRDEPAYCGTIRGKILRGFCTVCTMLHIDAYAFLYSLLTFFNVKIDPYLYSECNSFQLNNFEFSNPDYDGQQRYILTTYSECGKQLDWVRLYYISSKKQLFEEIKHYLDSCCTIASEICIRGKESTENIPAYIVVYDRELCEYTELYDRDYYAILGDYLP